MRRAGILVGVWVRGGIMRRRSRCRRSRAWGIVRIILRSRIIRVEIR